ncbi:hypothetical protein E4U54_002065 [Claviceps lovelessii]|nr:hypothetical protein E4U54_002065 [Claviceps lovelessii]
MVPILRPGGGPVNPMKRLLRHETEALSPRTVRPRVCRPRPPFGPFSRNMPPNFSLPLAARDMKRRCPNAVRGLPRTECREGRSPLADVADSSLLSFCPTNNHEVSDDNPVQLETAALPGWSQVHGDICPVEPLPILGYEDCQRNWWLSTLGQLASSTNNAPDTSLAKAAPAETLSHIFQSGKKGYMDKVSAFPAKWQSSNEDSVPPLEFILLEKAMDAALALLDTDIHWGIQLKRAEEELYVQTRPGHLRL